MASGTASASAASAVPRSVPVVDRRANSVNDYYETSKRSRLLVRSGWLMSVWSVINAISVVIEGRPLLIVLAAILFVTSFTLLILGYRSKRFSAEIPIVRMGPDHLWVRSADSPTLKPYSWSKVTGIAWAGDELGIQLAPEGEESIGDVVSVFWQFMNSEDRAALRADLKRRMRGDHSP